MTEQKYSDIRGFCYTMWHRVSEEQLRKELGYAVSLRLNSARIWLSEKEYEKNKEDFLGRLLRFVRVADEMGISTMPILFNGNGLDPETLEPSRWDREDSYVADVVNMLRGEHGLIMWDVMNEPSCNDYINKSPEGEKQERWEKMTRFLKHHCAKVRQLAPENVITIGHTFIPDVKDTLDDVDVISFHDYLSTRAEIRATYEEAVRISGETGKPFINSELCCLCRANPYDLALKMCNEYKAGWYLFELMIGGYWGDVHGIFYEDGTVRDPSIPAAVLGFYRNRSESAVLTNANKEGYAQRGIQMVKDALEENTEVFRASSKSIDEVLEAAEFCANLLEACELVPMNDPPTAQIERIRRKQDERAARKLAFKLAELLRQECLLL